MNLTNYAYIFFKNHFQVQKENSFKNLKRPFIIFPGTLKGNVLMANRESQFYGKRFQHDCVCACIKDDAEFRKVASAKLISLPRTRWIHVRLEMLNITWREIWSQSEAAKTEQTIALHNSLGRHAASGYVRIVDHLAFSQRLIYIPDLVWDDRLANAARQCTQKCQFHHEPWR